jgi:hypothetical protein
MPGLEQPPSDRDEKIVKGIELWNVNQGISAQLRFPRGFHKSGLPASAGPKEKQGFPVADRVHERLALPHQAD